MTDTLEPAQNLREAVNSGYKWHDEVSKLNDETC
jgi:hypothetical protein